ncbi:MAG: Flp family type IVb pilin [Planctomycetaceae bacterium]
MQKYAKMVWSFLEAEGGPTAVEYAIMLPLIAIVCIGAVRSIGQTTNGKFAAAVTAMQ